MKHFRIIGVGILSAILIGLAACAPKANVTQPASVAVTEEVQAAIAETQTTAPLGETSVVETVIAESSTETPAVNVEALILEKLQNHHSIDRVYAAQKTREEWNATLDRMISYGAKISEEEKKVIIDYLLSR